MYRRLVFLGRLTQIMQTAMKIRHGIEAGFSVISASNDMLRYAR